MTLRPQKLPTTPRHRLTLLIGLTMTLLLWTSSAVGQTTECTNASGNEGICVTEEFHASEVERKAEQRCATARALAKRIDLYREQAEKAEDGEVACYAKLEVLQTLKPALPWRAPWLLKTGLKVGAPLLGAAGGFLWPEDEVPKAVPATLWVSAAGMVGVSLLLDWLEAQARKD